MLKKEVQEGFGSHSGVHTPGNLVFVLLMPSTVLLEALLPVSTGERHIGNVLGEMEAELLKPFSTS